MEDDVEGAGWDGGVERCEGYKTAAAEGLVEWSETGGLFIPVMVIGAKGAVEIGVER